MAAVAVAAFAMVAGTRPARAAAPADAATQTPLTSAGLDPAAFAQWVDGAEKPLEVSDGPKHVVWTQDSAPQWDGVRFGESKRPGTRHLRIGWKQPLPVGSVLVRAGGRLSVLKSTAAYPGDMNDDSQWLPAERIRDRRVSREEVGPEEYAVWVLPAGTTTRALRFSHTAEPTEKVFSGWLGGAYLLSTRMANVAPQATVAVSATEDAAGRVNNENNDNMWRAWDNGPEGAEQPISREHAEWIVLTWPRPIQLGALNALWAGFGEAQAQVYTGPADRHPREAPESDWRTIKTFDRIQNQYPRALGVNWLDFPQVVETRAVRLRITKVTQEGHPHLNRNTRGGKRVWLGELLALKPLESKDLATAIIPVPQAADAGHPPIPIRFTLKEPGLVTLVIEDQAGVRVRNLVSETLFSAGENTVWWDGMDDLGRDTEAARHGIYHVPGRFVAPGTYRVGGLTRKPIELRYEFSIYNGGHPAWMTADNTGGWLTNHTPPQAALYVPGEKAPGGKPLVFLGSFVSEGGHGLAWVDLEGRKVGGRGWVGGTWTAAPFLARDAGAKAAADIYAYVGSAWEKELRLTALTAKGDRQVVKHAFPSKETSQLTGLAVHDGFLVCSLPAQKQLLVVDVKAGKVLGSPALADPRGLAFDSQGRLLVLAGKQLFRYDFPLKDAATLPPAKPLVAEGLEDPQHVTLDAQGNLYVSDRGKSHQVKVFSPAGKFLRAIGHAGEPKAGPYDPLHMNNPSGMTIDSNNHLWVTETDYQPKRVSVWTLDGKLVRAFYGPSEYGGGGGLDPLDKTRFYYHGMEFKLDWDKGTDQLVSVFHRPGADAMRLPGGGHVDGQPETALYRNGQRYFTNCYNSNPTNGAGLAMLWIDRGGIAVPVAALGRANDWALLKEPAFKTRWPKQLDPKGDYWRNQAAFAWSDVNADGHAQPEEVTILKASAGGVTVMPDFALVVSRLDDRTMRYAPVRFTDKGVPVYDLDRGQVLASDVQHSASSGGDQALAAPNGWVAMTVAPKPFAQHSLAGVFQGKPMWSYPSLWPGLHASHESPPPDRPGELIGTTRLLGGLVTPRGADAGPLWAVNSNQGCIYLFTADGLFVATLFHDVRQGRSWTMPAAERNMLLNDLSLSDENFWPSISQTADGNVYLVDGSRTSLVRVDGLETIRRIPASNLNVGTAELQAAQAWLREKELARQKTEGQKNMKVAIQADAPVVDGKLDDWRGAEWVIVDKRGVAAYFDSNSKPYDVRAAARVAGDRLYVAFRTADPNLLRNSGEMPVAPFKTGGALDLMLGVNPRADDKRTNPVEGDLRLLVTMVKDKPLALVYRAVVPGTKEPVPFSSPWRTITIDRVDNASDQVRLAGAEGNYEFSVPLAVLGLRAEPGQVLRGDLGVLRGNGFQTLHRAYWSNKATGLTSDVPSEAMLTPQFWGKWQFLGQ